MERCLQRVTIITGSLGWVSIHAGPWSAPRTGAQSAIPSSWDRSFKVEDLLLMRPSKLKSQRVKRQTRIMKEVTAFQVNKFESLVME